jgi:hypothetical protein
MTEGFGCVGLPVKKKAQSVLAADCAFTFLAEWSPEKRKAALSLLESTIFLREPNYMMYGVCQLFFPL